MRNYIFLTCLLSMILSKNAFCQNEVVTEIKAKLQSYNQRVPSERIYVHTDKDFYTAGDIIWFKVYQLDTSLNQTKVFSKVAYVELLDNHNVSTVKAKVELDEKGGSGSLELPLSLNSGYYMLVVYTNWMKNFGVEHFFQKKITVVNTCAMIMPAIMINTIRPYNVFGRKRFIFPTSP